MRDEDLSGYPQVITYNPDNTVNYIDTTKTGQDGVPEVYRQTFTYTNGNLTAISEWIKQ